MKKRKYGCMARQVMTKSSVLAGYVLSGILAAGNGMTVHAEHYTGDKDWAVNFTGNEMESNFKTADINDAIYNLQPGDSIDISLTLKNTGGKATDWWMTNRVLRSLEDTQKAAASGGYTYTLIYQHPEGNRETLYSSETVGGDKDGSAPEGLHEVTDSLSEYFYLDSLGAGEQGAVFLTVALDGETQGNTYQDTLADLTLNFAVEETVTSSVSSEQEDNGGGDEPGGEDPGIGGNQPGGRRTPPKTGDETDLMLYAGISLASGLGLLILALFGLRKSGMEKRGGED
nr:LPXTG cell wall anchor domain-containing protein [uncultured Acetatifactor sp.]